MRRRRPRPGRPAAADDHEVVELGRRRGRQPDPGRQLRVGRLHQHLAVHRDHHRKGHPVGLGRLQEPLAFRLVGEIPAVGHLVAGQELAYLRRARRPAVADDLEFGHRPRVGRPPGFQQRIHHRVELLLGRIPGLEQVIVEINHVDRVDGGAGVGVGGQQRPPRPGVNVHRVLEELDPVHLRHPVIGQEHRDRFTAQLHLAQRVEGHRPGLGAHDPVPFPVLPPQVPGHGAGHPGVVVHRQDHRPRRRRWRLRRAGRRHRDPATELRAETGQYHRIHTW